MGYALTWSPCLNCKRTFGYNPHAVPSIRVGGVREPICRECMKAANARRKEMGLDPHPIRADAYEAIDEHEL